MDDDKSNQPDGNNEVPTPQRPLDEPASQPTDNQPFAPMAPNPETDEAPATQADTQGGSKHKKTIIMAVVAVLALLLVAGAVWAYVVMNSPQRKLGMAMENLLRAEAIDADFEAVVETAGQQETYTGDFSAKTDSDQEQNYQLAFGLEQNDARLGLEVRAVDKTFYMQVDGLDQLGTFMNDPAYQQQLENPLLKAYIDAFNAKWFKTSQESVEQLLAEGDSSPNLSPSEAENEESINALNSAYRDHQFFIIEDKGDATIGGVITDHLLLKVDHAEYVAFLEELKEADEEYLNITDEIVQEARNNRQGVEKIRTEVWISQADTTFKQIKLYNTGAPDYLQVAFKPVEDKEVNVVAPENAQDITQLLQSFVGGVRDKAEAGATQPGAGSLNQMRTIQPGGARLQ